MTQKDYIKLALALREARPRTDDMPPDEAWRMCIGYVVGMLQEDNPRFNEQRFLDAVGY